MKKAVTVEKKAVTYYDTDKTTGQTITGTQGTITTTTTTTDKYTYNKKGIATKKVSTAVVTMSGSKTESYSNRPLTDYYELSDGRIIAGYNTYDANWQNTYDENSSTAYYYTGDVAGAKKTYTTTTTYANNGDGTYTKKVTEDTSSANYITTYTYKVIPTSIYNYEDEDGSVQTISGYDENGNAVSYTVGQEGTCSSSSSPNGYIYIYSDAEHTEEIGYVYSEKYKIDSVNVTLVTGDAALASGSDTDTYVTTDKTVTTTTYKYDKKKRVKSSVETTVGTDITDHLHEGTETYYVDGDKTVSGLKFETTEEQTMTDVVSTKYFYKGNKVKKEVVANDGIQNTSEKLTMKYVTYSSEVTDATSGKTTSTEMDYRYSSGTGVGYDEVVVKDGVQTTTAVTNPATITITIVGDGVSSTTTSQMEASTTTKKKTVLATPLKVTATYKYDSDGNVKSEKAAIKTSYTTETLNETYGNVIYTYDADGEAVAVEQVVTSNLTATAKKENQVKDGTTLLKKSLTITDSKWDRIKDSGYSCSRDTYTIKAKKVKKSLADEVEAQQWIIQNGNLLGTVGIL